MRQPLRRSMWAILAAATICITTAGCKTGDSTNKEMDEPTETQTVSSAVRPDPFAVAQQWAQSPTFDGLPAEVEERASSWKAGQVARLYSVTEGYQAVVHNYTTARDAPAVLLIIAQNASGHWKVVDAKLARTTHMWPEM